MDIRYLRDTVQAFIQISYQTVFFTNQAVMQIAKQIIILSKPTFKFPNRPVPKPLQIANLTVPLNN